MIIVFGGDGGNLRLGLSLILGLNLGREGGKEGVEFGGSGLKLEEREVGWVWGRGREAEKKRKSKEKRKRKRKIKKGREKRSLRMYCTIRTICPPLHQIANVHNYGVFHWRSIDKLPRLMWVFDLSRTLSILFSFHASNGSIGKKLCKPATPRTRPETPS